MPRRYTITIFILIAALIVAVVVKKTVLAEQSGSSPESGAVSRIKTIYDSLISLDHGTNDAGPWGNWGAMWNRIQSAAEWTPSGDATEADVANGKIFYKDSRNQKVGSGSLAQDFSNQSLMDYDDCRGTDCSSTGDEDSTMEEASWTNTSGDAERGVWKDTRSGLYWSFNRGYMSNEFVRSDCDFFSSSPRGSYEGGDPDCGESINTCAQLSLDSNGGNPETDWYLPSQKELLQAYIDGIYNVNSTFGMASSDYYWSSTESSDNSENAWGIRLYDGKTATIQKSSSGGTVGRCVRRD